MKHILTFSLLLFTLSLHAAFTRLATETYPGGGGGPTGGVTKAYVDAHDLATLFASTNYTDSATNALDLAHLAALAATNTALRSALAAAAASSTNYTDSATNALDVSHQSQMSQLSQSSTNYTDASTLASTNFVKANYLPLAGGTMNGPIKFIQPNALITSASDHFIFRTPHDFHFTDGTTVSRLTPDNSPVVTSNMLNGVLAPATNALQTALVATNDLLRSAISAEANARLDGDTALTTALESEAARAVGKEDTIQSALEAEIEDRQNADAKLLTKESPSYPTTRNIKWSGYNLVLYGPMLFESWNNIKAGTASSNTSLPDYLKNGLWNTSDDPFVNQSGLSSYLPKSGGSVSYLDSVGNIHANALLEVGPTDNKYQLESQLGCMAFISSETGKSSPLVPDDSPVVTSNMMDRVVVSATNDLEAVLVEYVDDGDAATYTSAQLYTKSYAYPFTQGNIISNTVSQWEGYWNGSNVYWSVTNYLEAGNAKIMKLYEIQTNGVTREVWNDSDKYDIFYTNTLAAVSLTNNYTIGVVSNLLDSKADRAWGKYCSTGEDAPNTNTTWISSQETVMAGGYAYRKIAVGSGTISVLVSHGSVPYATGKEASFTIGDGYGTNYFGYVAQDNFVLGADCEGITVAGGLVTMDYQVIGSTFPIMYWCDDLITKDWQQMNRSDGTAIPTAPFGGATWSLAAGGTAAKVHVNVGTAPQGFFSCMTTNIGGGTFKTNMRADFLDAGLMCTNTLSTQMGVIRPKFNGTTVEWVWSVE